MATTIQWRSEKRKVKDLLPADYNPRKMTEQERRDLEQSIASFGTVEPVIVNTGRRANVLIGGHQRTTIYADIGLKEIEVRVPDRELTAKEERELNLRLNKNTGSWDPEKLKELGLDLLLDVGFGDEDMQLLFDDVDIIEDEFNVSRAIKSVQMPKTVPGDIYQLGNHRLVCGSTEGEETLQKLMRGDMASLVWVDPPTNTRKEKTYLEKLGAIVFAVKDAMSPNAHIFFWVGENYIGYVQALYSSAGITSNAVCMWIRSRPTMSPKIVFNTAYVPCVYGSMGKPFVNRTIGNANGVLNKEIGIGNQLQEEVFERINVWIDPEGSDKDYLHEKPVTLAEKPFKRCSAPGHIILDPFAGAGASIIAAEQIGRHVRAMQEDPVLCDVIVQRWEEFTNKKAKKI